MTGGTGNPLYPLNKQMHGKYNNEPQMRWKEQDGQ